MISARMLILEAEKEQSQKARQQLRQQQQQLSSSRSVSQQFESDFQAFNPPTLHAVPSASSRAASLSRNQFRRDISNASFGGRTRMGGGSASASSFPNLMSDEEDKQSGRASTRNTSLPPTTMSSRRATSVKFIPAPPPPSSHPPTITSYNNISLSLKSPSPDNPSTPTTTTTHQSFHRKVSSTIPRGGSAATRKQTSPRSLSKQGGNVGGVLKGGVYTQPTSDDLTTQNTTRSKPANKPASPIINNATITPAEVVASRVLKRRLGGFTARSYAHRTFYQPPTTVKINEAVLQNDLLSRYGGLVDECPDLLFKVVDKEIATRRSSFQLYVDACQKLNVQALEVVCTQLSTTPGRHMQRGITIAGCPLSVKAVRSLASVLRTNSETLQHVALSNCSIGFVASASVSPDKIQRHQWKALPPLDDRNNLQTTTYANNVMSPALVELLAILSEPVYDDGVLSKEDEIINENNTINNNAINNSDEVLSKTSSLPASKLNFLDLASNNLSEADGKGLLMFANRTATLRRISIAQNPRISRKTRIEIENIVKRNCRDVKEVGGGGDAPSSAAVVLDAFGDEEQAPSPAAVPSSPTVGSPNTTTIGSGPPALIQSIEDGNVLDCAPTLINDTKRNPNYNFERQRQQRLSVRFAPIPTSVDTPTHSDDGASKGITTTSQQQQHQHSTGILMGSPPLRGTTTGVFPSSPTPTIDNTTPRSSNLRGNSTATTTANLLVSPRSSMFSQSPRYQSTPENNTLNNNNNNIPSSMKKHRPTTHAETLRLTQRHVTAIGTVMLHESKRKPAHSPRPSMSPQSGGGGGGASSSSRTFPSSSSATFVGGSGTDQSQSRSSYAGASVGSRRDFNSTLQQQSNINNNIIGNMLICSDDHDEFIPYSPWTTDDNLSPGAMATRMSEGLIRGSSRQQQSHHIDDDELGSPTSQEEEGEGIGMVGGAVVPQRRVTLLPPGDTAVADSSSSMAASYPPQSMLGSSAFGYLPTASSGSYRIMNTTNNDAHKNNSGYYSPPQSHDYQQQQHHDGEEVVGGGGDDESASSGALARFHENKPRQALPIQREEFFVAVRSFDALASGESGLVGLRVLKANLPFTFELFRRKFITKSFSKAANLVQVLQAVFNHHTRAQVIQALEDFSEFSPINRIRTNEVLVNADGKSVAHMRLRPDQRDDILAQFARLDTHCTGILHPDVLCDLSVDGAINEERQRARDVMQRMGITVIDRPSFIKLMAPYVLEKKKRGGWGPRHM